MDKVCPWPLGLPLVRLQQSEAQDLAGLVKLALETVSGSAQNQVLGPLLMPRRSVTRTT
jgi:hypothetical protein